VVTNTAASGFSYAYPTYDNRHRIKERIASSGQSWTALDYDNLSQLSTANVGNGRTLAYGYDTYGNRNSQGAQASHAINGLDQITARTLFSRGFGVLGSANPTTNPAPARVNDLSLKRWTGLSG
jgi:YD repeat-containing protein